MTNKPINIQIHNMELKDAFLVIGLLEKRQNTTLLTSLANSVLEQINISYFETNELNIFEYSTYITKLKSIIPTDETLNNLSDAHKEKLFGITAHTQITKMLNKISLNNEHTQKKIYPKNISNANKEKKYNIDAHKELIITLNPNNNIPKNKTIKIIDETTILTQFSFSNYIDETIAPLLSSERIPELLKQLSFINYVNDNLTKKQSIKRIFFTKNFIKALKNEKFLINFLPVINNDVYSLISSAINYDVNNLSKDDVQIFLNNILKNKTEHLINGPFFKDLMHHHINTPDDLNLNGLTSIQCLDLEKIKPNLLTTETYQKCITQYLSKKIVKNFEEEIETNLDVLLNTFNNRKNIELDKRTYANILDYISTKSTQLKNKNSDHLLLKINNLLEFVAHNTSEGTLLFSNFFENKSKFKKYEIIKPIWEKIKLEQKIGDTKTDNARKLKI